MVIFEIYFYFNFIIRIEKNLFFNKITNYISQLNNDLLDKTQKNYYTNYYLNHVQLLELWEYMIEQKLSGDGFL